MADATRKTIVARLVRTKGAAGRGVRVARSSVDVLLVHADAVFTDRVADVLRKSGYTVLCAASVDAAMAQIREGRAPRVVVVDLGLPGLDAAQFLAGFKSELACADARFVVLTRFVPATLPDGASFDSMVLKPVDGADLLDVVRRHCDVP